MTAGNTIELQSGFTLSVQTVKFQRLNRDRSRRPVVGRELPSRYGRSTLYVDTGYRPRWVGLLYPLLQIARPKG